MSKEIPAAPVNPEKKTKKTPDEWEVEDAIRTLEKAEEHKHDPVMMKHVHAKAGRKIKALKGIRSIKDLKDAFDKKFGSGADKDDDSVE